MGLSVDESLIPRPERVRAELDRTEQRRRDLRRLLRLAERFHGEAPRPPRPDGTKLEAK